MKRGRQIGIAAGAGALGLATLSAYLFLQDSDSSYGQEITRESAVKIRLDQGSLRVLYKVKQTTYDLDGDVFSPYLNVSVMNDSDEAKDYLVRFRVYRNGKRVHPLGENVRIRAVQPDTKGVTDYEITRTDTDADGETEEEYIGSKTGEDFKFVVESVRVSKHYEVTGDAS
ncbi:hypothetical protein ACFV4E_26855 [Streptomyces hygroscopicus]|uniref:hypothetical protein n=1 Tax=Streptomyces hygroscopicus TaxID=1912 RepID=UPI0011AE8196|nr:hypothetical protein [Streptomyces sp. NBRC 109436]